MERCREEAFQAAGERDKATRPRPSRFQRGAVWAAPAVTPPVTAGRARIPPAAGAPGDVRDAPPPLPSPSPAPPPALSAASAASGRAGGRRQTGAPQRDRNDGGAPEPPRRLRPGPPQVGPPCSRPPRRGGDGGGRARPSIRDRGLEPGARSPRRRPPRPPSPAGRTGRRVPSERSGAALGMEGLPAGRRVG